MRRQARQENNINMGRVQGYHEGGSWSDEEAYAFIGWTQNRYFTSDRYEVLTSDWKRPSGESMKGYGLEIETEWLEHEGSTANMKALAELFDKIIFPTFGVTELFKMQHDGSLNGASAECITQVMTQGFIRNHYKDFKTMYNDYFKAFGVSASKTGNCGMHVNISNGNFGKTQEDIETAVRKLYYIVNRHYNLCCALFNRRTDRTHYCRQMGYMGAKTMELHGHGSSHGVCFNLGHFDAGRIELRLVGGQSDYACFRNTMEAVFFLVSRVRKISWADCEDVAKIFTGCNQYVFDRLRTKCYNAGAITAEQIDTIRATVKHEELL